MDFGLKKFDCVKRKDSKLCKFDHVELSILAQITILNVREVFLKS